MQQIEITFRKRQYRIWHDYEFEKVHHLFNFADSVLDN